MDLSVMKTHGSKTLFAIAAIAALTSLAGTAQATTLTVTSPTVSCNVLTGVATPGTITVTPTTALVGAATIVIVFPASPGGGLTVALTSASATFTSRTVGSPHTSATFSVTPVTGCAGVAASTPVQFEIGSTNDAVSTVTDTITYPKLTVTPTVAVSCNEITGTVTPGTITVTPYATLTGGNTTTIGFPPSPGAGLTVALTSSSLVLTAPGAGSPVTSATFSVTPAVGCNGATTSPIATTVQFTVSASNDAASTVNDTITVPLLHLTSTAATCSSISGIATAGSVTVSLNTALTGANTLLVGFPASPGGGLTVALTSATLTLTAPGAGSPHTTATFSVTPVTGCVGTTPTTAIQFTANTNADATITVTDTLTPTILSATAPSPSALTCSTSAGYGTASTFTISPATALMFGQTLAVSYTKSAWVSVSPSSPQTLTFGSQSIVFTVNFLPGCVGATSATTAGVVHFAQGGGSTADINVSIPATVTTVNSGLVVAPVTIYCTLTPGSPNTWGSITTSTVSVASAATGGTPFTILSTSVPQAPNAWLTVSSLAGGTASATPVTFTVQAASGCGGFTSTQIATLSLTNAPAPPRLVTVTLQIVAASTTSIFSGSTTLTPYVKGTGTPGFTDIVFHNSASSPPTFSVNQASLPVWLASDTGTYSFPRSIHFSSTAVCDSLNPGSYTQTIYINAAGQAPFPVTMSLQINNKGAVLSVEEGVQRNYTYVTGSPIPSYFVTAVSTDSPIAYTVTTAGTAGITVSQAQQSGLAYSFGTPITVNFNPAVLTAAQPGNILTGTVTLSWGTPTSTVVVLFTLTIQAPGATLSGLSPASEPTAASGSFVVSLLGTGFVTGTDPTQVTRVGIVQGGVMYPDTSIAVNVQNSANIQLTINVPASDPLLSQFSTGGTIVLGVCNPNGNASCNTPSGVTSLYIGNGPIVQAVTSASSFVQVTPPAIPVVAPYDMITIWGANFCSSAVTGYDVLNSGVNNCASNQILSQPPTAGSLQFPLALTLDTAPLASNAFRYVTVTFQTTGGTPIGGNAPLLIATNGQINALVPAAVAAYITTSPATTVDIVVGFQPAGATGPAINVSLPFAVNVVATHPGMFTVGADGQGMGAILQGSTYAEITPANPAGSRATGAVASDSVLLYVTGLGVPDSTADNSAAGTGLHFPGDCISAVGANSYYSALDALYPGIPAGIDGTIIQSSLLNTLRLPPCAKTNNIPTIKIGAADATATLPATYAGFTPDSIAGLYQVNVLIPTPTQLGISSETQMPISITSNGVTSQTGVTIAIVPALGVTGPSGSGLTGQVNVPWVLTNAVITASQGSGTYTYAITSGLLPTGLSLVATGSNTVTIEGTPAANTAGTYAGITVTATDQTTGTPLTGSVSFTITITGGLFMTASPAPTFTPLYGTAFTSVFGTGGFSSLVTQVIPTGGVYSYSFLITSTIPAGMAIDSNGNLTINQFTPDGTYVVTVQATDSSGNAVTGSGTISFTLVVEPSIAPVIPVTYVSGSPTTIATIVATGAGGANITYSIPGGAPSYLHINSSTGALTTDDTTSGTGQTYTVVVTATENTQNPGATTTKAVGTVSVVVASNP